MELASVRYNVEFYVYIYLWRKNHIFFVCLRMTSLWGECQLLACEATGKVNQREHEQGLKEGWESSHD
jgi:hypothetical protein